MIRIQLRKYCQWYEIGKSTIITTNNSELNVNREEKEDSLKEDVEPVPTSNSNTFIAPTATPDVDEDGYSIRKEPQWETLTNKKGFVQKLYSPRE